MQDHEMEGAYTYRYRGVESEEWKGMVRVSERLEWGVHYHDPHDQDFEDDMISFGQFKEEAEAEVKDNADHGVPATLVCRRVTPWVAVGDLKQQLMTLNGLNEQEVDDVIQSLQDVRNAPGTTFKTLEGINE